MTDIRDLFTTYEMIRKRKPINIPEPNLFIPEYFGTTIAQPKQESIVKEEAPEHTQQETATSNNFSNAFLLDSLPELIKRYNLPVRITSGYRPGAKTKDGKDSWHSKKDSRGNSRAYDIVPTDENFSSLNIFYTNPQIRKWMNYNGLGILEETTPDIMARTGATGKHWHIGPDDTARNNYEQKINT